MTTGKVDVAAVLDPEERHRTDDEQDGGDREGTRRHFT